MLAADTFVVLLLTPLDVQVAFGVRSRASPRPRPRSICRRRRIVTWSSCGHSSRSSATRRARSSSRWTSSRTSRRAASGCTCPTEPTEEVVPEGELTLDRLVELRDAPFGSIFYLRFIQPLDLGESAAALAGERELARRQQSEFKAGVGRLARGGLLPRLGDGLFSLSLILRGTVPGATAAAAALKYAGLREQDGRFVYHGRVIRQSGWTICQYWFFFAYNPWRSGFHGVNDHESDWEMISVYLYEGEGRDDAGMGRLCLARLPRRRPAPPLRRPCRSRARGRTPRRLRRRRLACVVLPAGRVPGGDRRSRPRGRCGGSPRRWRRSGGSGSARATTPAAAADPLRRLRARRRPGHRAGSPTSGRRT